MHWLGVDPGLNGALALIHPSRRVELVNIDGSLLDGIAALREWAHGEPVYAVIEKAQSMPKQGVASSFKYGSVYGHLRGACIALGIPIIAEPVPRTWKQAVMGARWHGLSRPEQKRLARDVARELYPQCADELKRVKDADKAEALLLAHYGLMLERGK